MYETAVLFDRLALTQDQDSPFESALAGLAEFGALQCFQKVQDVAKTVQTAITAARLFLKTAEFSFQISRCIRETWADALADSLHCYRVAADLLKDNKKPYLAAQVLMEMAGVETKFDLVQSAGNTYEEAVNVIIDGKAHQYGDNVKLTHYCYFYKKLIDWIVKKLNTQLDHAVLENLSDVISKAHYPAHIVIAIGATSYTHFAENRFLQEGDEVCVITYNHTVYTNEQIQNLIQQGVVEMKNASIVRQEVIRP